MRISRAREGPALWAKDGDAHSNSKKYLRRNRHGGRGNVPKFFRRASYYVVLLFEKRGSGRRRGDRLGRRVTGSQYSSKLVTLAAPGLCDRLLFWFSVFFKIVGPKVEPYRVSFCTVPFPYQLKEGCRLQRKSH